MKRAVTAMNVMAAIMCFFAGAALATPGMINYQGKVEVGGEPFGHPDAATGYFRFAIVNDDQVIVWNNDGTQPAAPGTNVPITVSNGLYNVLLGDTSLPGMTESIPYSIFSMDVLKLRIWFDDGQHGVQVLTPDQRITSAGYAFNAQMLNGMDSDDFMQAGVDEWVNETGDTMTGTLNLPADGLVVGGDQLIAVNGKIGIGTTDPGARLNIECSGHALLATTNYIPVRGVKTGSGTFPGVQGETESESSGASGVRGRVTSETPGANSAGVYGVNAGTGSDGIGVRGRHSGSGIGVMGEVVDSAGYAGYFAGGKNYFEGAVGIGKESPVKMLEVKGNDGIRVTSSSSDSFYGDIYPDFGSGAGGLVINSRTGGTWADISFQCNGNTRMFLTSSGRLGIGTTAPGAGLHVVGADFPESFIYLQADEFHDAGIRFYSGANPMWHIFNDGDAWQNLRIAPQNAFGSGGITVNLVGWVGIGTTSPSEQLEVAGAIKLSGSDLAEPFAFAETDELEPGMVVVIDRENPGELKISDRAYDRCVAGVISGAGGIKPGVLMSDERLGGSHNVALAGRVYTWCDASFGSIEPGDMLVTSPVCGYAMRADETEAIHGAVIGKAMEGLKDGRGLVLILISQL